jgi:hypothetical protein
LKGFGRLEIAPSLVDMARKSGSAPASVTSGRPEITTMGTVGRSR